MLISYRIRDYAEPRTTRLILLPRIEFFVHLISVLQPCLGGVNATDTHMDLDPILLLLICYITVSHNLYIERVNSLETLERTVFFANRYCDYPISCLL